MICAAIFSTLKCVAILAITGVVIVLFGPNLPPYDLSYDSTGLSKTPLEFEGPMAKNFKLNKAQLITDKVVGTNLGFLKVHTFQRLG